MEHPLGLEDTEACALNELSKAVRDLPYKISFGRAALCSKPFGVPFFLPECVCNVPTGVKVLQKARLFAFENCFEDGPR